MNDVIEVTPQSAYATFLERLIARIIDVIILWIPTLLLNPRLSGLSFLLALLYYPVFEGSVVQATPGKRAMGIIVTDENGARLTVKKSLVRFFMSLVSGFILLIGYILFFFTKKKQTLHDLVAETLVVKGRREGELGDAWLTQLKSWFR